MPGSNEYSKAPENRTGASKSNTTPVSTVKKEITNPSKDLTAMKMKTIPGEINLASILSKPAPTQSRLDMDIRHHAAKTLSKPAALQSQVDMDLTHVLTKMPDEMKQEMVTHGNKLVNKPKWSATNASVDAGATTYKVQAGNTLGQIVADYNKKNGTALKWQDVAKWSGITDPSKMRIGHVINFADPTQAAETAATPAQPATPPTPIAPQNPVVTPADTVAVTTPRDTAKVATPRDTVKAVAVDTSKVSQPIDTARAVVADTSRVAPRDSSIASVVDTTKTAKQVQPAISENKTPTTFNMHQFYLDTDGAYRADFNDKDYIHYDPKGAGDFYIDSDGHIYEVPLMGYMYRIFGAKNGLGKEITKSSSLQHNSPYYPDTKRGKEYTKLRNILSTYGATLHKQGGTMNRINYFQQGGAAPQQQDLQQQIIALVQAAMQGDQKATETVNKIMEAAKAGDQQAVQLAQMIQQVVEQMKGQATAAKWGAKLGYIKSLKYAKGGKACPACEKGKQIEMKACGGKKAKKRYFGGLV